jgi:hypothetical protein
VLFTVTFIALLIVALLLLEAGVDVDVVVNVVVVIAGCVSFNCGSTCSEFMSMDTFPLLRSLIIAIAIAIAIAFEVDDFVFVKPSIDLVFFVDVATSSLPLY